MMNRLAKDNERLNTTNSSFPTNVDKEGCSETIESRVRLDRIHLF